MIARADLHLPQLLNRFTTRQRGPICDLVLAQTIQAHHQTGKKYHDVFCYSLGNINSDACFSPWIFLLDSLGNRHPRSFQCLQQYLAAEAKERMNVDLDRAGCKPLSCYGKVPRQRNYCDCGVYLLHYAEVFLSDPRKYLTLLSVSGHRVH
jgi:Ulp1 protease family, C-terminal catalytic domain